MVSARLSSDHDFEVDDDYTALQGTGERTVS